MRLCSWFSTKRVGLCSEGYVPGRRQRVSGAVGESHLLASVLDHRAGHQVRPAPHRCDTSDYLEEDKGFSTSVQEPSNCTLSSIMGKTIRIF